MLDRLGARACLRRLLRPPVPGAWDNADVTESDDLRQFIRDIAARHERIWREQADILREMVTDMRALREETRADHEDARADHRAHTQALLRVLDRLENGGAAA